MTLSAQLRVATRELHTAAERAGTMPALLRGALPLPRYLALLRQLQPIYAALEHGLQQPRALAVDAMLRRGPALQADIDHLSASVNAAQPPTVLPEAQDYARHLGGLPPVLLAAHAYVRYLGDLAGGQVLARIIGRAYALSDGGLRFYHFDADPAWLAQRLRAALDALPAADHPAIVDEACAAFGRHVALFEALAAQAAPDPTPSAV